jgi:hypothetical protein
MIKNCSTSLRKVSIKVFYYNSFFSEQIEGIFDTKLLENKRKLSPSVKEKLAKYITKYASWKEVVDSLTEEESDEQLIAAKPKLQKSSQGGRKSFPVITQPEDHTANLLEVGSFSVLFTINCGQNILLINHTLFLS